MKGQGALEYLIIIAAVLGISAVVVLFVGGAFIGSSGGADLSKCRLAAANCQKDMATGLSITCPHCETACVDSSGKDLLSKIQGCGTACQQCKQGIAVSSGSGPSFGLVGYWNFDDGKSITTLDSSGNGNVGTYTGETFNHGTLTNGPKWISGQYGSAVYFNQSNLNYISVGTPAPLNLIGGSAITVAAWIKPEDSSSIHTIYGRHTDCNSAQGTFRLDSGILKLVLRTATLCSVQGSSVVPPNTWTHVAYSWNGTHVVFYINGEIDSTVDLPGTITATNVVAVNIGAGSSGGELFNGSIDSLRVWNRALNLSEIRGEMNSPRPVIKPLADWEFEENNGLFANDTHIWVAGRSGTALSFDGLNDVVTVPNSPIFDFSPNKNFSVEAWVNVQSLPPDSGAWDGIVGKSGQYMMVIDTYGGSTKGFTFGARAISGQFARAVGDAYTGINVWKHLAGVYNGTHFLIYVNGTLRGTQAFSPLAPSANSLEIGKILGYSWLNGTIDEVRLYNRALSPDEIMSHYSS